MDMDTPEKIETFVRSFYSKLLKDEQLAPIFLDVAAVDLEKHMPLICAYWEKLLLGRDDYKRHTMNIHRAVDERRPLHKSDFDRWLHYFTTTVDELYSGDKATRAKRVAATIAENMQKRLSAGAPD